MKRAAFGLLCLFVLVPAAAFAQINSFGPTSFYSFEFEQNATIHGVDLFGDFYGDPDSSNIFLSTQLIIDGPAGTFTRDISGGFRTPATMNDTIYVAIPDETLLVEGHYSVTVLAHDDTGDRFIGPVFYDVIARPIQQNPLLAIPENVFAAATSASGANVSFYVSGISFVDPAPVITCDHHSGDLYPIGETIVHCTATDSFGSASGSFPVFVYDSGAPTVTVPADIVTSNPVVTFTASATDIIDGPVTVTCTPHSGDTFDLGTTTVNCIAYDSQGNAGFGSFHVTVSNGPVLTLPAPITAEATSSAGAAVSFTVTATDNATIVCTPASGSTFAFGTTTVSCTATASTGTTTGSFTVTVVDTTAPALSLPVNITAEASGPSGKVISYTATANDLVDGSRPVTCDHASGSTFPITTTTVQCTASDSHGNVANGSFTVTIRDTTPPVLSLPADITAEATGPSGAAVSYSATANDLVDGSRPVTCDHASGSTFPLGTTTVQCTATDTHNNTANGSFTVTVRDTSPPTIVSISASPSILWPPNHQMVNVSVSVIATDLVDPAPMSHIVSVSSNQPLNGTGDGDTAPDWVITGPLTLQLRSERASGVVRVYTITIATTDASGNTSQGTVTVNVGDGRGRAVH